MFTSGDASPLTNMKRSESNHSIRSQMWDSSDPNRNPAPLPLPDRNTPIAIVKTQSKISAAHQRLGSTNSARNLSSLSTEASEVPQTTLYDLVQTIHSNLEVLMKRSQNNARDLGKLRGDVKNPFVVEEIKKILQDTSVLQSNSETDDPEKKRLHDSEMALKLDALIKLSQKPPERPSLQQQSSTPLPEPAVSDKVMTMRNDQIIDMLATLQKTVDTHLPIILPSFEPPSQAPIEPVTVTIDTSALEATVNSLNTQISHKLAELQRLDATLLTRRTDLAALECRTSLLQSNLLNLLNEVRDTREQEDSRNKSVETSRTKRDGTLRKKKSNIGKRGLFPLGTTADRRIVSLTNIPSSPRRHMEATKNSNGSSSSCLAPPLRTASPFQDAAFVLPNQTAYPANADIKVKTTAPLPLSLDTSSTARKSSWSKRVSGLFSSSSSLSLTSNKENVGSSGFGDVFGTTQATVKRDPDEDLAGGLQTLGRGFTQKSGLGSVRSFRSFSHR